MSVETQFPIRLTERAIARIKQVLARQGKQDAYLRIGVRAGGCSGYEHVMLPVDAPRPQESRARRRTYAPCANWCGNCGTTASCCERW